MEKGESVMNNIIEATGKNLSAIEKTRDPATETELENCIEVFGDNVVTQFAKEVARVYGVPVQMCLMLALGVVSIAMGRAFKLYNAYAKSRYGNIFVLAIAESGTGKSLVLGELDRPLREKKAALLNEFEETEREIKNKIEFKKVARKKLMAKIVKLEADRPDPNTSLAIDHKTKTDKAYSTLGAIDEEIADLESELVVPELYVDNITPEALAERLNESGGHLGIISAECADILNIFTGRYAGGQPQLTLLNKGYSGEPYQYDRRAQNGVRVSMRISEVTLALATCVQSKKAYEFFSNKEVRDQGTVGRFSLFNSKMKFNYRAKKVGELDSIKLNEYYEFIKKLVDQQIKDEEPIRVEALPEARKLYDNYHNELGREMERKIHSLTQEQIYLRSSENAQAIGLLLNICDNIDNRILDADTAARAIEIDKGLTTDAFRVLDSLAIHENTKTLERILNVILNKGSITTSKLQNSHNFKAAEIEEFKKAIEDNEVPDVRFEKETASNNKTQTTFIAT